MELLTSGLQQNFPVVMKNKINNWKILNYTEDDWCNIFKDKTLKFRKGQKKFTKTPLWEGLCESDEITLKTFFELSSKNLDYWLYYDYKYVKDVLPEGGAFIDDLKWTDVGLVGLSEEESVLWIGNKGAHTPCHKDTYGCNLVAQLYGRKLWILIPPGETNNLKPSRVPYEESSIYSLLNFYSPEENLKSMFTTIILKELYLNKFGSKCAIFALKQAVKEGYKVILSPGDVLFVPRNWWHYVENLEPAISINIWIPLEEDHESRIEESLVRYYVSNICQDLLEEDAKQLLNPNEYSLISEPCTINLIEKCLENYKKFKKELNNTNKNKIKLTLQGELAEVGKLCVESFIQEKNTSYQHLFGDEECFTAPNPRVSIAKTLINTYSTQDNINLIKTALLAQ